MFVEKNFDRAFQQARRNGVLSLVGRDLKEIPSQVFHLEDHLLPNERIWECLSLVKLDLSSNSLTKISSEIGRLNSLSSIKLSQNQLQALPNEICTLSQLTFLDLSHNMLLGELPASFGDLVQLRHLRLTGNKLNSLPDSIGNLSQLEVLEIDQNSIRFLPESLGSLARLRDLSASSNQLTTLPDSIGKLKKLALLNVSKNTLQNIPTLQNLSCLNTLDLRQNQIGVFPLLPYESVSLDQVFLGYNRLQTIDEKSIERGKHAITMLDIRDNQISKLPLGISLLYKLKTLDMSNNNLSELPPGLGYLKYLNKLLIDGNPMRGIRRSIISSGHEAIKKYLRSRGSPPPGMVECLEEEIDEFSAQSSLVSNIPAVQNQSYDYISRTAQGNGVLDIKDHQLSEIPNELFQNMDLCLALTTLDISNNQLNSLPQEIGLCSSLVTLIATNNGIRSIDSSIAALTKLQVLHLQKNQINNGAWNDFCRHIGSSNNNIEESVNITASLVELDLQNNKLGPNLPYSLCLFSNLDTLQLGYNSITTLKSQSSSNIECDFPWHFMRNLSNAILCDNQLSYLGSIYAAPNLKSLNVENNNISTIPLEMGCCQNLRTFYLNGNPQRTIRHATIGKGHEAILQSLKNRLPANFQAKYHNNNNTNNSTTSIQEETEENQRVSSNDNDETKKLEDKIKTLTNEMEGTNVTAAKKYYLKKELAKARALKIRLERGKK